MYIWGVERRTFGGLNSSDGPWVDTVDSNVVRLPELLCPDARQRLLGGLCGGIHGLPGDAETGGFRRDDDDPAAPGDVLHDRLGQEYGPLDVGGKVRLVELHGDLVEVRIMAERGAVRRKSHPFSQVSYNGRQRPHRRARAYYQLRNTTTLVSAVINLNGATVERTEGHPDSQGPVDWIEYEQIANSCNENPEVLAEIEKLKLPPGGVCWQGLFHLSTPCDRISMGV